MENTARENRVVARCGAAIMGRLESWGLETLSQTFACAVKEQIDPRRREDLPGRPIAAFREMNAREICASIATIHAG